MEFKRLEMVKWREVEIGEIVCFPGCNYLIFKESKYKALIVADDVEETFAIHGEYVDLLGDKTYGDILSIKELVDNEETDYGPILSIYRIPKEIQELYFI